MKKKRLLTLLIMGAVSFATIMPSFPSLATADEEVIQETEGVETEQPETETEPETEAIPESFYLPIESNEVKNWPAGPQIEAEAAVVMDADTRAFLYSKNCEAKEYPASITKVMTALVAIENSENLNKKITFSEYAVYSIEADSSHIGIQPGEKMKLIDALYGLMLESANDAANGIAEYVAGSLDGFAQLMNEKAAQLGCINTHFVNAHGLHSEDHYTCARDMALIMQAAVENPILCEIMGTKEYMIKKTNKVKERRYLYNHNKMLVDSDYTYEGCIGGKTGFTSDALNTLVTADERDGRTLISVILRTNGASKTYTESTAILDYGFSQFTNRDYVNRESYQTKGDLLGVRALGDLAALQPEVLGEPLVEIAARTKVSLPNDVKIGQVDRSFNKDGTVVYSYQGWQVGETAVKHNILDFDVLSQQQQTTVHRTRETDSTEQETQSNGTGFNVRDTIKETGRHLVRLFDKAKTWVMDHQMALAIIIFVIIILLIPMLCVAFIRTRTAEKIRRERRKEREEIKRISREIESKPVSEIEEELRAKLEQYDKRKDLEEQKEEKEIVEDKE